MENSGKTERLSALHERMENLVNSLDELDPEKTGVEDIDRIITKLDELEEECQKHRREFE
ncbi:hypothetical protein CR203_16470 [Salipaludibacillus neizhouensis]|uniref:Uncharacterized protein n=1 Tax=Salipaludibacillus neizhouensis TaxID=885475 RepID=A0A3A9K6M2_9BACI|nr:SE1561 family protein [Salipaludibacillus neizhouensis]RKL66152.1 hypothetical protein CR203_16470 [Salipaludibacillus neizhouensis]